MNELGAPPLRADEKRRTLLVLAAVCCVLVLYNVARSTVLPSAAHFGSNVALALVVAGLGSLASLRRSELGLEASTAPAGLALGAAVFGVVVVVVAVAAALPATAGAFEDDRAAGSFAHLLLRVLIVIPIGTVLVEELIFRGVLFGLLGRILSPLPSLLVGAVIFGLWHVFPAGRAAEGPIGHKLGAAVGTLLATTIAGVAFGWLRARSGSLVAPMLAHLATNTVALAAAWIVAN